MATIIPRPAQPVPGSGPPASMQRAPRLSVKAISPEAGLELVENGGDAPPHQAPGGVRLGVAAHYRHPFPGLGHGRRQVGHGGGLPDAPFP